MKSAIFEISCLSKLEDYDDGIEIGPADPTGRARRFDSVRILAYYAVR